MRRTLARWAVLAALCVPSAFGATIVGVELQLLVDVSGSVSDAEFNLQTEGYAQAFESAAVKQAIENQVAKGNNGVAVQYIQWSGSGQQSVTVDWALLSSAAEADAFAAAIRAGARAFAGSTGIQSALSFGAGLFANDFDGLKQVADVSGDGECNSGCGDDLFGKTAMTMPAWP